MQTILQWFYQNNDNEVGECNSEKWDPPQGGGMLLCLLLWVNSVARSRALAKGTREVGLPSDNVLFLSRIPTPAVGPFSNQEILSVSMEIFFFLSCPILSDFVQSLSNQWIPRCFVLLCPFSKGPFLVTQLASMLDYLLHFSPPSSCKSDILPALEIYSFFYIFIS